MGTAPHSQIQSHPSHQLQHCFISSGYALVALKLDCLIVYLLQQTWSSEQDAKPAGEAGKSHWVPLLRSRLQWLNCYPYLHLAGWKFTWGCLHKLQTHPWLKGRHTPRSPQHPLAQFSPAPGRDALVSGGALSAKGRYKSQTNTLCWTFERCKHLVAALFLNRLCLNLMKSTAALFTFVMSNSWKNGKTLWGMAALLSDSFSSSMKKFVLLLFQCFLFFCLCNSNF